MQCTYTDGVCPHDILAATPHPGLATDSNDYACPLASKVTFSKEDVDYRLTMPVITDLYVTRKDDEIHYGT